MKKITIILGMALVFNISAFAEDAVVDKTVDKAADKAAKKAERAEKNAKFKDHLQNHYKFYGFIRNYFDYDNRESYAGTGDLYYWIPKDMKLNDFGEDMNEQNQFRFLSLTSRVGVDVSGYQVGRTIFGGKIEADFYAPQITNMAGTAQLRLRQAFCTVNVTKLGKNEKASIGMKFGQAWHPMAVDLPDVFSLESGAPFNAFSRTPQCLFDFNLNENWTLSLAAIWQMQYTSSGPSGANGNYMKYSCVPEMYFAVNYKNGGWLARAGVDVLSIKPRWTANVSYDYTDPETGIVSKKTTEMKVQDRITTATPYIYAQYTKGLFAWKAKTLFTSAGEHINQMSGYAVKSKSADNSLWEYTPLHASSTWTTFAYGKTWKGVLFLGYVENFGTFEPMLTNSEGVASSSDIYFQKNGTPNVNRLVRVQPEVVYTIGKFQVGLEYMMTAAQYGGNGLDSDGKTTAVYNAYAKCVDNLHWVVNNRVQMMIKFNF